MTAVRIRAFAAPAAFSILAILLAGLGKMPVSEALWTVAAVAYAFSLTGWIDPAGWRRWAAEALLLPTGFAMTLMAEITMRRMLVPPLLMLAAWAALSGGLRRRAPGPWAGSGMIALFGLSLRAAVGPGAGGPWEILGALALSAVIPGVLALSAPTAGVLAALVLSWAPLHQHPAAAVGIAALSVVVVATSLRRDFGRSAWVEGIETGLRSWFPMCGAAALVGLALGWWGGPPVGWVLPGTNWVTWVGLGGVLAITLRLYPAAAGATTLLACLLLGPVVPPTPEGRAVHLTEERTATRLRPGTGAPYILQVGLGNGVKIEENRVVARLHIGEKKLSIRAGRDTADTGLMRVPADKAAGHSLPNLPVWRPPGRPGEAWRVVGMVNVEAPEGAEVMIERHPGLEPKTRVIVSSAGPLGRTSVRSRQAENWLWLAAAFVALVQLVSGVWSLPWAWPSWMVLTAGMIVSRMPVEPLHILLERYCVDLCLAAVLMSWIPAAAAWVRRGRPVFAAAWLLVPLALATPSLTPPMWGDEPFHLALMESLVVDRDLDLSNNLQKGGKAAEMILESEHFFHSPVYGFVLAPAYWVGGRTGALAVLALLGSAVVGLVGVRLRTWLDPPAKVFMVVFFGLVLSYPLATFSTQIWPGMVGIVAVALGLALVGGRGPEHGDGEDRAGWGRWAALAAAFFAVAVKTRFALMTFPVAAAGWWKRGERRWWAAGLALGGAAAGALALGWVTMGHPFGPFRRLHHLLPDNPAVALTVVSGLLFDVAGGLAWTAPLWLLAVACFPALWRRGGPGERGVLLGGAATVVFLLHSTEWYGGGSPPARYLVALLPAVWLALGLLLTTTNGRRRLFGLLMPPTLLGWWLLVTRPHFSINPGDGSWWLTNALARRFGADARSLFPSFLVPNRATWAVSAVLLVAALLAWWLAASPRRARVLLRLTTTVWLVAATGLVAALDLRCDRVVEVEAAQVRRHGGVPAPPIGTPARYSYLNGRRLADGDGLTIPLRCAGDRRVSLVGRFKRPTRGAILEVRWDDGEVHEIDLSQGLEDGAVDLPAPTGEAGRRVLRLVFRARPKSTLVVDKIVLS